MSDTHEEKTDRTVQKVQLAPLWSVVAGVLGLAAIAWSNALGVAGCWAGLIYLLGANALLARGLHNRAMTRFGPANAVTAARSTLVGLVTALVAASFVVAISVPLLIVLTVVALALDGVDGWVARRTRSSTELGARFDMEVDAFLLLVLSAYVAQDLGWWVLTIGMLRYAFIVAGWIFPWMTATLPPRYWRKVVTAVAGIALTVAASGLVPLWVASAATILALGMLLESFGRDTIWLVRRERRMIGS
jgi:phosphatidylglycerophosphate synthase